MKWSWSNRNSETIRNRSRRFGNGIVQTIPPLRKCMSYSRKTPEDWCSFEMSWWVCWVLGIEKAMKLTVLSISRLGTGMTRKRQIALGGERLIRRASVYRTWGVRNQISFLATFSRVCLVFVMTVYFRGFNCWSIQMRSRSGNSLIKSLIKRLSMMPQWSWGIWLPWTSASMERFRKVRRHLTFVLQIMLNIPFLSG